MAICKSETSAKVDALNRSQVVIESNLDGTVICGATKSIDTATRTANDASRALA
jgi:hypothetical protein